MFVSVISLSFYAVMAFTTHEDCTPPGDIDSVSNKLQMVFIVGFSLHAVNFVTSTFVEPALRSELVYRLENRGVSNQTRNLFWTSFLLEHLFRVGFVLFSIYQIILAGN